MADTQQTGPIDQKWFMKSATIWGIIIAAVPPLLEVAGYPIAPDTVAEAQSTFDQAMVLFNQFNEVIGGAIAVFGRIRAQAQLWFVKKPAT